MVIINDEAENEYLISYRNEKHNGKEYWIGLRQTSSPSNPSDHFSWVDGSDEVFNDWKSGEPNDVIILLFVLA